jgi:thiosulfate/3-mercaptopyruvate sulfurtransferase
MIGRVLAAEVPKTSQDHFAPAPLTPAFATRDGDRLTLRASRTPDRAVSNWSKRNFAGAVLAPILFAFAASTGALIAAAGVQTHTAQRPAQSPVEPWTPAQTVQPQDLVKELVGPRRPTVVCVGFRPLFDGAHVPGAVFHGPASTAEGLDDLRKWAQYVPRTANVVVYCGCCPMAHCPNIRPGFEALREIGFTHLRVLMLPDDFATDWVARGYPVEKGK